MENEFTRGHTHGNDSFSLFSLLSLSLPALSVYFHLDRVHRVDAPRTRRDRLDEGREEEARVEIGQIRSPSLPLSFSLCVPPCLSLRRRMESFLGEDIDARAIS